MIMDIRDELIKILQEEIMMVKSFKSDGELLNANCPSAFGLTDWNSEHDGSTCCGGCRECWLMNFTE